MDVIIPGTPGLRNSTFFNIFFYVEEEEGGIITIIITYVSCFKYQSDLNLPIPVCDVLNIRVTLLYFPMPMSLMDCVKPNRVDISHMQVDHLPSVGIGLQKKK